MPFTGYVVNSPNQQQWPCTLGGFIINFGAIESHTYEWIRRLEAGVAQLQRAIGMPFKARADLVMDLVDGLAVDASLKEEAREAWDAALELAEFRNRVAHGPIVYAWKGPEVGEAEFVGIPDYKSATGDRLQTVERIDLARVTAAMDLTGRLAQDLSDILERLRVGSAGGS
jgi:hypothetical protein